MGLKVLPRQQRPGHAEKPKHRFPGKFEKLKVVPRALYDDRTPLDGRQRNQRDAVVGTANFECDATRGADTTLDDRGVVNRASRTYRSPTPRLRRSADGFKHHSPDAARRIGQGQRQAKPAASS